MGCGCLWVLDSVCGFVAWVLGLCLYLGLELVFMVRVFDLVLIYGCYGVAFLFLGFTF